MNAGAGHEPLGINVSRIGRLSAFTVGGFVLALGASLVIWIVWHGSDSNASALAQARDAQPPAPIALDALRARQRQALSTYGWADREAGIARIPVRRAMALLAAGGVSPGAEPVVDHADRARTRPTNVGHAPEPRQ